MHLIVNEKISLLLMLKDNISYKLNIANDILSIFSTPRKSSNAKICINEHDAYFVCLVIHSYILVFCASGSRCFQRAGYTTGVELKCEQCESYQYAQLFNI